jgi:hypothetical protein
VQGSFKLFLTYPWPTSFLGLLFLICKNSFYIRKMSLLSVFYVATLSQVFICLLTLGGCWYFCRRCLLVCLGFVCFNNYALEGVEFLWWPLNF